MYVIGYSHPKIQFVIIIVVKQEEKEHNKSLELDWNNIITSTSCKIFKYLYT
jgi:hypothetical protein